MSTAVTHLHGARTVTVSDSEQWTPPLDARRLADVLTKVREWEPLDWDAVFDDLADVLDDRPPMGHEVIRLTGRLHGALTRTVRIALAGLADQTDQEAAVLIALARSLLAQRVSSDHPTALGHLRRLGWITNELLELLSRTGHLTHSS